MKTTKPAISGVDAYIEGFPVNIQTRLKQLRATIIRAAPGAEELISYQMPSYKLDGILVHFAACKNHIGFYPGPSAIVHFENELSGYPCSNGAVRFPNNLPLPLQLVSKIVASRVKENREKIKRKNKSTSATSKVTLIANGADYLPDSKKLQKSSGH